MVDSLASVLVDKSVALLASEGKKLWDLQRAVRMTVSSVGAMVVQ